MEQGWTKESIQMLLAHNDKAVAHAVKVLYSRQTAAEQAAGSTREHNGRGFNSRDAAFLTSIAQALPRYNDRMTPKQMRACRRMLPKYWRQLVEEANAQAPEKAQKLMARLEQEAPAQQATQEQVVAGQEMQARQNKLFGRF